MPTIADSDYRFLDRTRRLLGIGPVSVRWSALRAKWPDIWCYPSARMITITQEWKRQPIWERRKRIVHELLHFKGLKHGGSYSTYPERDTFSKAVYGRLRAMTKGSNPVNPSDKIWIRERELRALPKRTLIGIYKRYYPSASVDATTSKDRLVAGILEATFGRRNPSSNLTPESIRVFTAYAKDAVNWGGTPMVGGNVGGSKEERGNLTQLKLAGLISTQVDEGNTWITFTPKGREYARSLGIDLGVRNPIIESAITGLGFGAGLLVAKGIMGKVIKNPVGETIRIDGVNYLVMKEETVDSYRREGKLNTVRVFEKYGHRRDLYLRRPKGNVMYYAVQYRSGRYSTPVSVGRWS